MSNVLETLRPVLQFLKDLDLSDSAKAKSALDENFPLTGELGETLRSLTDSGLADGSLCGKEAGPSKFSRVAKPADAEGFSVDAVLLWGDGPWHKHVEGEVNALLALEGDPEFCGHKAGWCVFSPGSQHVPSVKGGKMMIFYMLPNGAVEWKR
ncbi:DUF4863 family protein [Planctomycetota bacterium]|nr:DUF4863 family protein [Planctomycetota bacterium]